MQEREYFRAISKSKLGQTRISITTIIRDFNLDGKGFWGTWDKSRNCLRIVFDKPCGKRVPVYKNSGENEYYSMDVTKWFKGTIKLMIVVNETGMMLIPAVDDEIDSYSKRMTEPGVYNGKCIALTDDMYDVIREWDNIRMTVINNVNDGSYIVLENKFAVRGKRFDENYCTAIDVDCRSIYLPEAFLRKTNIRRGDRLPMWIRQDGALIIEGKPRTCKICGKKIHTYKTPLTKQICKSCDKTIISDVVREYMAKFIKITDKI